MGRGGTLPPEKQHLSDQIAEAIERQGVVPALAARIARQLVIECDEPHLRRPSTWSALGTLLQRDVERLREQVGLVERQVIVALPKLSAAQIEDLLATLRSQDPRIARTVLNTALDAADPVAAAHRYLKQFHAVADRLRRIDPDIARTFANGDVVMMRVR
jgi:hypothetical protein